MQYCYWMQSIVQLPLQVEQIIQFYTVTAGMYWSLACCQNSLLFTHKGKLVIEDPLIKVTVSGNSVLCLHC